MMLTLFTNRADPVAFDDAVQAVQAVYAADGLTVEVRKMGETFARFFVTDETGRSSKVEMGYDWRSEPPTVLEIGPVLHPDDAVANKVSAVFSRAEARDYVDVGAALASGRYTGEQLLRLMEERDPGFDRGMFVQALHAADRWDDEDYTAYGLDIPAVGTLRSALCGRRSGRGLTRSSTAPYEPAAQQPPLCRRRGRGHVRRDGLRGHSGVGADHLVTIVTPQRVRSGTAVGVTGRSPNTPSRQRQKRLTRSATAGLILRAPISGTGSRRKART